MNEKRDRETCIVLYQKAARDDREFPRWLVDHPQYEAPVIAGWLNCGSTKIKDLRIWAREGFGETPTQKRQKRYQRRISDGPTVKRPPKSTSAADRAEARCAARWQVEPETDVDAVVGSILDWIRTLDETQRVLLFTTLKETYQW